LLLPRPGAPAVVTDVWQRADQPPAAAAQLIASFRAVEVVVDADEEGVAPRRQLVETEPCGPRPVVQSIFARAETRQPPDGRAGSTITGQVACSPSGVLSRRGR
jgi:hypothetical protein